MRRTCTITQVLNEGRIVQPTLRQRPHGMAQRSHGKIYAGDFTRMLHARTHQRIKSGCWNGKTRMQFFALFECLTSLKHIVLLFKSDTCDPNSNRIFDVVDGLNLKVLVSI